MYLSLSYHWVIVELSLQFQVLVSRLLHLIISDPTTQFVLFYYYCFNLTMSRNIDSTVCVIYNNSWSDAKWLGNLFYWMLISDIFGLCGYSLISGQLDEDSSSKVNTIHTQCMDHLLVLLLIGWRVWTINPHPSPPEEGDIEPPLRHQKQTSPRRPSPSSCLFYYPPKMKGIFHKANIIKRY